MKPAAEKKQSDERKDAEKPPRKLPDASPPPPPPITNLKRSSPITSSTTSSSKTPKLAISLPPAKEKAKQPATLPAVQLSSDVKKVFGDDSSEEEAEEIPLEARIRMRNKGRENPVACGPNSYGKTRLGFCDYRSMQERELDEKAKELGGDQQ